jgi:hypothetical protein
MKNFGFCILICLLLFCDKRCVAQDTNVLMIRNMPQPFSTAFHCRGWARAVNHLRRLGKDKALEVLQADLLESPYENAKVLLLSRLLFRNPSGWTPPILGIPVPEVGASGVSAFPLFPLALSDNVPFVILRDYELEGRGEFAAKCLRQCLRLRRIDGQRIG